MAVTMSGQIDPRISWPPQEDRKRLKRYEMYRDLYEGEHRKVFVDSGAFKFQAEKDKPYLFVNLVGALTDLLTGRLLGQEADISLSEGEEGSEALIKHARSMSEAALLELEAAKTASITGDAFLKVRYDADNREILYDSVDPACVFPEFDLLNRRVMVAANVGQVLWDNGKPYLWIERHERGRITNRLWKLEDDKARGLIYDPAQDEIDLNAITATQYLPPEQETGVDALLLVHIPNELSVDDPFWGASDYEDLAAINGAINECITDRRDVIRKHVDPPMTGPKPPEDAIHPDGKIDLKKMKYIEQDPSFGAPVDVKYLVWDANLSAVADELKDLKESFAVAAGIELSALVAQDGGGPQSGRALRLSQMRTQATVQAKQRTFGPGLARVYSLITQLATGGLNVPLAFAPEAGQQIVSVQPTSITVDFGDGLPSDSMGDTEEQVALVDAKLQSRRDAIKTLYSIGDAEADAKLADIDGDTSQASPVAAAPSRGSASPFAAALGIGGV